MKSASSLAEANPAGPLGRMVQAWNRFWFAPVNPTTLGLIRLCAGILTVYTHLAYSYDLREFFGPNAWMSLEQANEERRESPWPGPQRNWVGMIPPIYLPPDPADRAIFVQFIKEVADNDQKREQLFEYIRRPEMAPPGMIIPNWVIIMAPKADPPRHAGTDFEAPAPPTREQLVTFIKGLPTDKVERDYILDYMERRAFDPRQLVWKGSYTWSVWYHVTDPTWMVVTHTAIVIVMVLFTIGFCTRVTSVLTWLAAVSYIQRSPITLFGGDTMMNILLFYLMIGPSGAALSVDRLLAQWWRVRHARLKGLPIPEPQRPAPSISANFVLKLLMVHFCIIYLSSGTSKLLGGYWWNGTAVYYTLANYEFAPLPNANYRNFLQWLCQHRLLWELFMTGGSYFTLALEIGFPFLVWNRRLRPFMVAASMMLHVNIALFMGLTIFSLFMATLVMSFVPGEAVEQLLAWLRRRVQGTSAGGMAALIPAPAPSAGPDAHEDEAVLAPQQDTDPSETGITPEKSRGRRKKDKHKTADHEKSVTEKA